jgi:hypothetical protein
LVSGNKFKYSEFWILFLCQFVAIIGHKFPTNVFQPKARSINAFRIIEIGEAAHEKRTKTPTTFLSR